MKFAKRLNTISLGQGQVDGVAGLACRRPFLVEHRLSRVLELSRWCVQRWKRANGCSFKTVTCHRRGCLRSNGWSNRSIPIMYVQTLSAKEIDLLSLSLPLRLIIIRCTKISGYGSRVCQVLNFPWWSYKTVVKWPWNHLGASKPIYCDLI